MKFYDGDCDLNFMGEFTDTELEKEFFQQDMQKTVRYIKPIVLMLGILNTLFLIPDYFLVGDRLAFLQIAATRTIFILLIIGLLLHLRHISDYRLLSGWITAYEFIGILLFLYVFCLYDSPDYLIQAFGVMTILIGVFMVPNRWINIITASLLLGIIFLTFSWYRFVNIPMSEYSAGVVYIAIVTVLCSVIAHRNNCYKRLQYMSSRELLRLSTTDHLSGAYNRAKFDYDLKYWMVKSKKEKLSLSLMMLDFDDFKRINDEYGHLTGDNVIIETTALIMDNIRETDVFARWGGEEFVLLLPNTNKAHAVELIERLRKSIEDHDFMGAGRVTCSFGVVQMTDDDDAETLLKKADKMLYKAKNAGKNSVVSQ